VARDLGAAALACLAGGAGAASGRVLLDFTTLGEFSEPFTYSNCGVAVRGSAQINMNPASGGPGLAVAGGEDGSFDSGETLDVAFAEPAIGVAYQMSSNFYVTVAGGVEFDLDAFGSGDVADVGSAHIETDQPGVDLSDFFDDAPLSGFEIVSSAGGSDGQQLGSVTWRLPEPGYAASGFATVATLACLVRRRRPAGS
jgi:hypothetical protein